ncbi:MAG: carbon-phosphorus lyase [Clostridia bacterium]|nr:carbon-phosphorus lyase [Clostridia bacterium]
MKLIFYGTAAAEGFPGLFCECEHCQKARELGGRNIRTRTSCLIDGQYLFDFPPDVYMQALHGKLRLSGVRHIIVTHSHEDHFQPDELKMKRPPFAYPGEDEVLRIYGNDRVFERFLKAGCDDEYNSQYLRFVHVGPGKTFNVGEARVTPFTADHNNEYETCHIYAFSLGGRSILYGHDTGYFPECTWEALRGFRFDAVILDCTFGGIDWDSGHMGMKACAKVKERLVEQDSCGEKTIFIATHFSHNCAPFHESMTELANSHGFIAAYDGMTVEI